MPDLPPKTLRRAFGAFLLCSLEVLVHRTMAPYMRSAARLVATTPSLGVVIFMRIYAEHFMNKSPNQKFSSHWVMVGVLIAVCAGAFFQQHIRGASAAATTYPSAISATTTPDTLLW